MLYLNLITHAPNMHRLRDVEIWVNLNEIQDNKSELQRTIKELRA